MCHYDHSQLNDEDEISESSDIAVDEGEEEDDDVSDVEQMNKIENYLSVMFTKLCDDNVVPIEMFSEPEFRIWIRNLIAIGAICGHERLKALLEGCWESNVSNFVRK